jgi:hypothetical protein
MSSASYLKYIDSTAIAAEAASMQGVSDAGAAPLGISE